MDGNRNIDLDENLAWLTQKTEDLKSNKGKLTFSPHTVNAIERNCKILKKVATPPFSGLSSLSSKKFRTPPSDSVFGSSYPPLIMRGRGGSNYVISTLS